MKLKKAVIYGFGMWQDTSFSFSDQGIMYIFGDNESGKSTLFQFIHFMLFGLPPRKRHLFYPKKSHQFGGQLYIELPDIGDVKIERLENRQNAKAICKTEAGAEYGEKWLRKQLQGMTSKSFQNIFSFSAIDLNDVVHMQEKELMDVLLSLGFSGRKELHNVEQTLDKKLGDLFKPQGSKPVLNQLITELDRMNNHHLKVKNEEKTYHKHQEKRSVIEEEIKKKTGESEELGTYLTFLKQLDKSFALLEKYKTYEAELRELPMDLTFPGDGKQRYYRLKEQRLPVKSEYDLLEKNCTSYKEEIEKGQSELWDTETVTKLDEIINLETTFHEHQQKYTLFGKEKRRVLQQYDAQLKAIDIDVPHEEWSSYHLSLYTEKTWQVLRKHHVDIKENEGKIRGNMHILHGERKNLMTQKEELTDLLLPEKEVQTYRTQRLDYEHHLQREKLEESQKTRESQWEKVKTKKQKSANLLLMTCLFIGISTGLYGIFSSYDLLYTVALAFGVIGLGQYIWQKHSLKSLDGLMNMNTQPLDKTDISEDIYHEAVKRLEEDHDYRERLTAIYEQLEECEKNVLKNEEELKLLQKQKENLQEELDNQYREYPFLKTVPLDYWPDMFSHLQRLSTFHEHIENQTYGLSYHDAYCINILKDISDFFNQTSIDFMTRKPDELFKKAKDFKNEHEQKLANIAHLKGLYEDTMPRLEEVKQELSEYNHEIKQLFAMVGVETGEGFLQKGEQNEKKENIKEKVKTIYHQLAAIFSVGALNKILTKPLYKHRAELEKQPQLRTQYDTMRESLDMLKEEKAELNVILEQMEHTDKYSTSQYELSMMKDKLNIRAKEWAIYKTAKEMLHKAKQEYQETYLPAVIRQTRTIFEKITNGRYIDIRPPHDKEGFFLVMENGLDYSVDELSQGTKHQLYIAFRLAIAIEMCKTQSFPFIIDDAFVHFDDRRRKEMFNILNTMAKDFQMIVLTCDKNTKTLLETYTHVFPVKPVRIQ